MAGEAELGSRMENMVLLQPHLPENTGNRRGGLCPKFVVVLCFYCTCMKLFCEMGNP